QGMNAAQGVVLITSAAAAGAVNSVAGGGTMLTFPALLWSGEAARIANATSTVALWPGQLSSLLGYRKEIGNSQATILALAGPSLVGGFAGARLLLGTSNQTFEKIVPFLILGATLLFIAQEPLSRKLRSRALSAEPDATDAAPHRHSFGAWAGMILFQLVVAIYGGYFGAGIGILMLAALGMMQFRNIHQMNGLKNINGLCINLVAAVMFVENRLVDWRLASIMAAASVVGGYTGAGAARRIGQSNVRKLVIAIGLGLTVSLFVRR
ncbi:MAG TPA: sulfite exporter TauE/SafE family protein, partial [Chthonomonadales bacterium]|nr:sulfite exporter TauE/SafE family protein [Chthonomonadales bacterium]